MVLSPVIVAVRRKLPLPCVSRALFASITKKRITASVEFAACIHLAVSGCLIESLPVSPFWPLHAPLLFIPRASRAGDGEQGARAGGEARTHRRPPVAQRPAAAHPAAPA